MSNNLKDKEMIMMDTPSLVDGYDAKFWHESYNLLRDAVMQHLDDCIRDDDVAEESILVEAIETAGRRLAERAHPVDTPSEQKGMRRLCKSCFGEVDEDGLSVHGGQDIAKRLQESINKKSQSVSYHSHKPEPPSQEQKPE